MVDRPPRSATFFRVVAAVVFIGGGVIAGLMDQWGFYGRLPGLTFSFLVAPWIWSKGRRVECQNCQKHFSPPKGGGPTANCPHCGFSNVVLGWN